MSRHIFYEWGAFEKKSKELSVKDDILWVFLSTARSNKTAHI